MQNLSEDSLFNFACHDALPCFTQCCKDVNIYLTPYDALRLRHALRIESSEFLSRYTMSFLSKVGNIPVVQLMMDPHTLLCPFVAEEGCSVYEDRPWACRMFPLDLSCVDSKYRIIARKERCMGLFERSTGTVADWLKSQGILEYAQMDREYQSVVPKGFKPGAPMNEGLGRVLFMAYDLDRFAELLADNRFLALHEVDDNLLRLAGQDAKELLRLAFRYIRAQMDELYQCV
ncbi:MAG TPA: YkgJ family cysteine cluster protein [Syntrophobacteraceae bacterium]|nr:YkgJ family cysteine cluster protein [Syntrophobacteraceae bacterium]